MLPNLESIWVYHIEWNVKLTTNIKMNAIWI